MRKIDTAILAATQDEINLLTRLFQSTTKQYQFCDCTEDGSTFPVPQVPNDTEPTDQTAVLLVRVGIGKKQSLQSTERFFQHYSPHKAILFGYCGGLNPTLKTGTIVNCTHAIDTENQHDSSVKPARESGPIQKFDLDTISLPFQHINGTVFTSDRLLDSIQSKLQVYKNTNADIVDMETYHVASIFRKNKTPLYCIRIVFDAHNHALPLAIANCVQSDGILSKRKLASTITNPKNWKDLNAMRKLSNQVKQACRDTMPDWIESL